MKPTVIYHQRAVNVKVRTVVGCRREVVLPRRHDLKHACPSSCYPVFRHVAINLVEVVIRRERNSVLDDFRIGHAFRNDICWQLVYSMSDVEEVSNVARVCADGHWRVDRRAFRGYVILLTNAVERMIGWIVIPSLILEITYRIRLAGLVWLPKHPHSEVDFMAIDPVPGGRILRCPTIPTYIALKPNPACMTFNPRSSHFGHSIDAGNDGILINTTLFGFSKGASRGGDPVVCIRVRVVLKAW